MSAWAAGAWAVGAWVSGAWAEDAQNVPGWADAAWSAGSWEVGSWGSATAPDTVLHVSFDTPSGALKTGPVQTFRVYVRKTGTDNPTCAVSLYESGSLVSLLATVTVTSSTGQLVSATWDAAALADPSGAGVECYISGTAVGDSTVEVGAVAWDYVIADAEPAPAPEQPTGGWATMFAREQRALRDRERKEREEEEKAELAREIEALESHLAEQGVTLETESVSRETELARLRALADQLQAPSTRTLRALAYAERARTEAAIALAMREAQKALEEEELAILLVLAMDS